MYSLATDDRVATVPCNANAVELQTNKIARVVRSTFAAEGSAMSMAIDRHLYARLLFRVLLYGEAEAHLDGDWRRHLRVGARSLYDHMQTTGSMPAERSAMLDLLAAKELVEGGVIRFRWTPTHGQLADHLTKQMTCLALQRYLRTGQICLTQTEEQKKLESHLHGLRKGQRERRKLKLKASNVKDTAVTFFII